MRTKIRIEVKFPRYCHHCKRRIPVGERFIEFAWDSGQKLAVFCLDCCLSGKAIRNTSMAKRAKRQARRILRKGLRFDPATQNEHHRILMVAEAICGRRVSGTDEIPAEIKS